jgi:tetratricopeptide (TPR) repeat protein
VLYRQGRGDESLNHLWQALDRFRAARPGAASDPPAARGPRAGGDLRAFCREALAQVDHIGDREGQAHTWQALGVIYHGLGEPDRAVHCYRQALHLWRGMNPGGDADVFSLLGDAYHALGEEQAARDAWQEALAILEDLRHPDADVLRSKLHQLR